jgi:hypothetical protein
MATYRVVLPSSVRSQLYDGITEVVVEAVTEAMAKTLAKGAHDNDLDHLWDSASVEEMTQDLDGVVFTITVDPSGTPQQFQYTGLSGDGWEEVAAALELLCEVPYTSSWTPESTHNMYGTLLIATGGGTDDLGDKEVTATAIGPNGENLTAEFFQNIVDQGIATDNLSVDILATCPTPRVITKAVTVA